MTLVKSATFWYLCRGFLFHQTLIQHCGGTDCSIHEIQSVCLKYVGPVLLTGEVEAERGGSAIQIEVPAAVVSHVSKIGLNWSKWANLGGKETRGLNFRDFWGAARSSQQRGERHCESAAQYPEDVKWSPRCPHWPRPSIWKSLAVVKCRSYPPSQVLQLKQEGRGTWLISSTLCWFERRS